MANIVDGLVFLPGVALKFLNRRLLHLLGCFKLL